MKAKVLVTGMSSYLGSHVIDELLKSDKYEIRTIVDGDQKQHTYDALKSKLGDKVDTVEIMEANLLNRRSIFNAVEGCDMVIHTDSPFDIWSDGSNLTTDFPIEHNEDKFIIPAVDGTKSILEACAEHNIKWVIITSSTAAIVDTTDPDTMFDETNWIKVDENTPAFPKSKFMMETIAWMYWDKANYEIVTLCPGFMIGPNILDSEVVEEKWLREATHLLVPDLHMTFVDVWDVAKAHVQALDE